MRIDSYTPNVTILEELGSRLKSLRIDMRLTQAELAKQSGVSVRTITNIETGHDISLGKFLLLLKTLHVAENLDHLIEEQLPKPVDMQKLGKKRQRYRKSKTAEQELTVWKWGDEE